MIGFMIAQEKLNLQKLLVSFFSIYQTYSISDKPTMHALSFAYSKTSLRFDIDFNEFYEINTCLSK